MNTFQLGCFLAAANHLNFAKAAKTMNISQPAITYQIKSLEEELGVSLFKRSTRRVSLTAEGESFVGDAQNIVFTANKAKLRFQNPKEKEIALLSLGAGSSRHHQCLLPVWTSLSKSGIHPRLFTGSFEKLLQMLEDDALDMVFDSAGRSGSGQDIEFLPAVTKKIVLLCRREDLLCEKEELRLEDLKEQPLILFDPFSLTENVVSLQADLVKEKDPALLHFCQSADEAILLVKAGYGFALLPENLIPADGDLCAMPIEGSPEITFGLYYKKQNTSAALAEFLLRVKEQKIKNENVKKR